MTEVAEEALKKANAAQKEVQDLRKKSEITLKKKESASRRAVDSVLKRHSEEMVASNCKKARKE